MDTHSCTEDKSPFCKQWIKCPWKKSSSYNLLIHTEQADSPNLGKKSITRIKLFDHPPIATVQCAERGRKGGIWWKYSCPWICQAFKEDPWAGYLQGANVNSQRESWTGSLSWERSRASLNATSHETQSQRPEHNLIRPERVISCLFWGCSHYTLPWEKEDAVYSSRPTGSAKFIFPYKWRPVLLTFFQLRLDLFIFTHLQEMGTFQSIILSPGKQFVLLNHGQRQISHSLHMLPQRFI